MGIEHISSEPAKDDGHVRGLDSIEVGGIKLYGVTRGGVETCLMAPDLGVMFDIGMVPPGALKADRVLVSHAHADHMAGIHYLLAQRTLHRLGRVEIYMPAEAVEDVETILAAWARLEGPDARPYDFRITGVTPGKPWPISVDLNARPLRSTHRVPSIAWQIERLSRRLRPDLVGAPREKIIAARDAGEDINIRHAEPILCVSGDTQIELWDQNPDLMRCKVLVHEVTSWGDTPNTETTRMWGHTHVEEIISRCEQFEGEALVLVHRSMRHSRGEAERVVRERFPASVRDKVHVFGH